MCYGNAMDMEWAKDGVTGELFSVQARPETVQSRKAATAMTTFDLKERGSVGTSGTSVGESIAVGPARVLHSPHHMDKLNDGDVLVTERTDPDWGPIMKRASAIVMDHGGRTSLAAIVSREVGVPAVVGTGDGTRSIQDGQMVTVSCAEGSEGFVYDGALPFEEKQLSLAELPNSPVRLMINLATPDAALHWWRLPVNGVGLARMEFIVNDVIKIHPLALTRFDQVEDPAVRATIEELTAGYQDKSEYFVDHLARGIATIAASQYPDPVIVRMSDLKTNEYA